MREILFRGKRLDNGGWIKGSLITPTAETGKAYICTGNDSIRAFYEVDADTVGEYTGRTDKNGKKVFEGDMVEYRDSFHEILAPVIFDNSKGRAMFGLSAGVIMLPLDNSMPSIEVVGNIYEN